MSRVLHIVPGTDDIANGMAVVARLLAKEQGDAQVTDLKDFLRPCAFASENATEVWVHGMWLPKEWLACWRVIKSGKKLVRMTHGSLSPLYLKHQSPLMKWLVGPIERWCLRRCDRIVATCEAEKGWIERYLGKKCPPVEVTDIKRFFDLNRVECVAVGNDFNRVERVETCRREGEGFNRVECVGTCRVGGGDSGRVERVETCRVGGGDSGHVERVETCRVEDCVEDGELHLLYLGRRHPLKGIEYLEKAVAELNSNPANPVNPVQKISTRSTRSTRLIQNISTQSTRSTRLKIVSNAFGEELKKAWDWCDVLVLPTLSENFGLVVAEALERGKCVITTDGAPAWGEGLSRVERVETCRRSDKAFKYVDEGLWNGYDGRLIYLKGYRGGTPEERVRLLKSAIASLVSSLTSN